MSCVAESPALLVALNSVSLWCIWNQTIKLTWLGIFLKIRGRFWNIDSAFTEMKMHVVWKCLVRNVTFKIKTLKVRQPNWLVKDKTLYLKKGVFKPLCTFIRSGWACMPCAGPGTWIKIMAQRSGFNVKQSSLVHWY